MLRLKRSETDSNDIKLFIMLATIKNFICPVTTLCFLFIHHLNLLIFHYCLLTIIYSFDKILLIAYTLGYLSKKLTQRITKIPS